MRISAVYRELSSLPDRGPDHLNSAWWGDARHRRGGAQWLTL
jgi:hypothetical protein